MSKDLPRAGCKSVMAKCKGRLKSGRSGRQVRVEGQDLITALRALHTLQQSWDLWWFNRRDLESVFKF